MEKPKRRNRKGKTVTPPAVFRFKPTVMIVSARDRRKDSPADIPVLAAKFTGPEGAGSREPPKTDLPAGSAPSRRRPWAACPIDRLAACRNMGFPRSSPTCGRKSPDFRGRLFFGNGRDCRLRHRNILGAASAQNRRHPSTTQSGQSPGGDCDHPDDKQAE